MVLAVRAGASQRSVARHFRVSLSTLQLWLERAAGREPDEVDWHDRPPIARTIRRTPPATEDLILQVRRTLREESDLGEYGPVAIQSALAGRVDGPRPVPSRRTIARVLERRGALDARRRVRRPAPPPGWHLPDVRAQRRELDSFDVVEGLQFLGGAPLDVLTAISLHGTLPGAWPVPGVTSAVVVDALTEHWRRYGLPGYAQFDNDSRFIGGWAHPNSIGAVIRLCLAVEVVPVFVPPHEVGFQASIEAFNGRWQRVVWRRQPWVTDLAATRLRSDRYLAALRASHAQRVDAAPDRRPFPSAEVDLRRPPAGRLVFVRRTSDTGTAEVLGLRYPVSPLWPHRLVRAELDLDAKRLRFFALRRRAPTEQPLLAELPYEPPPRWYR